MAPGARRRRPARRGLACSPRPGRPSTAGAPTLRGVTEKGASGAGEVVTAGRVGTRRPGGVCRAQQAQATRCESSAKLMTRACTLPTRRPSARCRQVPATASDVARRHSTSTGTDSLRSSVSRRAAGQSPRGPAQAPHGDLLAARPERDCSSMGSEPVPMLMVREDAETVETEMVAGRPPRSFVAVPSGPGRALGWARWRQVVRSFDAVGGSRPPGPTCRRAVTDWPAAPGGIRNRVLLAMGRVGAFRRGGLEVFVYPGGQGTRP